MSRSVLGEFCLPGVIVWHEVNLGMATIWEASRAAAWRRWRVGPAVAAGLAGHTQHSHIGAGEHPTG